MGQNFNKNTYHATGQAAYLDLEAAKNNFDALASSFCGPQDPAALGFSEPGMLWLNNSTGILSQRNESNSGWVTLFDVRNSRIATGRVTAASIADGARKPSLINGQAITPASCSLHTPYASTLQKLAANFTAGAHDIYSSGLMSQFGYEDQGGLAGYSSYYKVASIRLGRSGTVRTRLYGYSPVNVYFRGIIARNGAAVGTHRVFLMSEVNYSDIWIEDLGGWNTGDDLELWVDSVSPYQLGGGISVHVGNPSGDAVARSQGV